jgi:hypothetical protein
MLVAPEPAAAGPVLLTVDTGGTNGVVVVVTLTAVGSPALVIAVPELPAVPELLVYP